MYRTFTLAQDIHWLHAGPTRRRWRYYASMEWLAHDGTGRQTDGPTDTRQMHYAYSNKRG